MNNKPTIVHTYTFYSDPGHAWLQVPLDEIERLAVGKKISNYSYRNAYYAFLEEDCDASVFLDALTAAGEGYDFKEVHHDEDSVIREYHRWGPSCLKTEPRQR